MKTLTSVILIAAFVLAANLAKAETYFESVVSNTTALKTLIGESFTEDMERQGNYLYQNDIRRLESDVKICFYISHSGQINILKIDCENCDAATYAKQVLHMKKIKVTEDMMGKKYQMTLKLQYKAV